MQRFIAMCACALVLVAGLFPQAQAGVPLLIPHQGRLLDADDQPVDGVVPIEIRLFDSSEDLVALWTEVHPAVVVTGGLFDIQLGSVTPLTLDMLSPPSSGSGSVAVERYLEVVVDGAVLSPRLRLGTTPYAMAAGRVTGDLETAPGELRLSGMGGSTTGTIRMMASPDSTGEVVGHDSDGDGRAEGKVTVTVRDQFGNCQLAADTDDDGVVDNDVDLTADAAGARSALEHRGGSTTGTIRMMATPDSTGSVLETDSDDDGFADGRVVVRITPRDQLGAGGETSLEMSTDRAAGGPRQSVSLDGSFSHAQHRCATDLDRDGNPDVVLVSSSSSAGAVSNWYVDSDDDGVPETSMELQCSPGGTSSKAIQTKGTGAIASVRSSTPISADSGATLVLDYDDDGDGLPTYRLVDKAEPALVSSSMEADTDDDGVADNSVESSCTATSTEHAIHTKGTGAQSGRVMSSGSRSSDDGVVRTFVWRQTEGLLGVMESEQEVITQTDPDSASVAVTNVTGGKGTVVVRSGMSGSTTGTIRMAADSSGVIDYLDLDDDGDGVAERYILRAGVPQGTTDVMVADFDGDGHADLSVSSECDTASAVSRCASDVDDDGTEDYSVETSCDATRSSIRVQGDLTVGSGSMEFVVGNDAPVLSVSQDGTARCVVRSDSGLQLYDPLGAKTAHLSTGGTLTVSGSLSLGSVASSHFIDVQGGAYCDGTDWVNGSDVSAKENFKAVDGEALLDRIADLKITRWNYKGQPQVEHIGPMAQDFQAAFGVGANDKTISTIDPSGIALAAIQALQKQNRELAGQNEELREQLERLSRKVDALVSTR